MYLGYGMGRKNWKKLMDKLRETKGVTINSFPKTDKDGYFIDFEYVLFEYNELFFYIGTDFKGFYIIAYQKINPYTKRQISYPHYVKTFDDIMEYINKPRSLRPLSGTYNQKIYLPLNLSTYKLRNELSNLREKNILSCLDRIEMVKNFCACMVLRFWHKNKSDFFDYKIITN